MFLLKDSAAPPYGFKVDWYDAYNAKLSWKENVNENITVLGYKVTTKILFCLIFSKCKNIIF